MKKENEKKSIIRQKTFQGTECERFELLTVRHRKKSACNEFILFFIVIIEANFIQKQKREKKIQRPPSYRCACIIRIRIHMKLNQPADKALRTENLLFLSICSSFTIMIGNVTLPNCYH